MVALGEQSPGQEAAALAEWYCLRSQPKHEHIAAAHLQTAPNVEAFLPRVRFRRPTRQGIAWVTEPLFPNYLFARFNWQDSLRLVQSVRGVSGVVHFGERWPVIPAACIRELQELVGSAGPRTIPGDLLPGDAVQIVNGAMHGLAAVVRRVMPAKERVAILMEFLGRTTEIEVSANSLIKEGSARATVFSGPAISPPRTAGVAAEVQQDGADQHK